MVVFFHGDESHGRINPYKSPNQNKETRICVVDICRSLIFFAFFFCVVALPSTKTISLPEISQIPQISCGLWGVVQKTVKVNIFDLQGLKEQDSGLKV